MRIAFADGPVVIVREGASGELDSRAKTSDLGPRHRADGAAPLIGSRPAIREVRERIERVAATDFTVLIEGASGPQPHPSLLSFLFRLPSVSATGRWRERGRMRRT